MEKKEKLQLSLQTLPNGYGFTVNGVGYMYFNLVDLLAGFLTHVGLEDTASMERGTILSTLFSAMMGNAYADAVTTLKQRVGLLTNQYNTTIERMDKAIEYVTQAEKTISGFINRLDTIELQTKGTEMTNAKTKKAVDEVKEKLAEIEKQAIGIAATLSNSDAITKAIEFMKKQAPGAQPAKEEKPAKEVKQKGNGKRNKAADERIMNAIEKKAKDNPNIK